MNAQYLQVFIAFILAQALMTSILVYDYQKEKNCSYMAALKAYTNAEVGYFIIGIIAILVVIFILSDWINLTTTKEDLLKLDKLNFKQQLRLYFKTAAIVIGAFVQYLAFKFKSKGKIAIDKITDKL